MRGAAVYQPFGAEWLLDVPPILKKKANSMV
jgi:hypothetical protein